MKKYFILLAIILLTTTLSAQTTPLADKATTLRLHAKQKHDSLYIAFINKELIGSPLDENSAYSALLESYSAYIAADSLYRESERIYEVNEFRNIDTIATELNNLRPYLLLAGVYYNQEREYSKSYLHFIAYANYPRLKIFNDKRITIELDDTLLPTAKYFAAITAMYAKEYNDAIKILNDIIDNYTPNDTYTECEAREYLAATYKELDNTELYINTLEISLEKCPKHDYLALSLIDAYLSNNDYKTAFKYIDKCILTKPDKACEYISLKGTMMTQANILNYKAAEKLYKKALRKDKNCANALEGLGILYALKAQNLVVANTAENLKEKTIKKNNTKIIAYYKQAARYLEEYYEKEQDKYKQNNALKSLEHIYFRLGMMSVDIGRALDCVNKRLSTSQ